MTETSAAQADPAEPVTVPGGPGPLSRRHRWFWLTVALVALAALVVGGSVQHVFDQRRAARALYGNQLLSTASRVFDEENRQIALPVARRSAGAFGSLGDRISADQGINGEGTLSVQLGTGSVRPLRQIAFEATVSSPYASTTIVVWDVRDPADPGDVDAGSCLLSSTLVGSGRAQAGLDFGSLTWQPCTPDLWRPSPASAVKPDLALAGIPTVLR